jgi:maltose O-acetyltransferase
MRDAEKQKCGQLYNPTARDISEMRSRGTALVRRFNACDDPSEQLEILRALFAEMGENVRVNRPFYVDFGCHTHIGRDTVINLNCTFLDAADIHIGSQVLIGPDVKIYTTFHPTPCAERFAASDQGSYFKTQASPVRIEDDTWIGGNATILPGVHIGKNAVIGAGSVVTKDIPDNVIAAGNPCKVIKDNS